MSHTLSFRCAPLPRGQPILEPTGGFRLDRTMYVTTLMRRSVSIYFPTRLVWSRDRMAAEYPLLLSPLSFNKNAKRHVTHLTSAIVLVLVFKTVGVLTRHSQGRTFLDI